MSEFKPGDRVRVTYEAEYVNSAEVIGTHGTVVYPVGSVLELIERANDPSKDPVGTVRGPDSFGNPAVKIRDDEWRYVRPRPAVGSSRFRDSQVTGYPVIGAVPGTPAAEAQKPMSVRIKPFGEYR